MSARSHSPDLSHLGRSRGNGLGEVREQLKSTRPSHVRDFKVLAGGPTRETESDLFRLHREGLEAQRAGRFQVHITHEKVEPPDEDGPRWTGDKIDKVALARQNFMDEARPFWRYDALFMVDSDVIIGPGVLKRMWQVDAPVVYGVFWTQWPGFDAELPQVWDTHPYGYYTDLLKDLVESRDEIREHPVFGGGACTLIRGRGFDSHYHPLMEGLRLADGMLKGEDRTYCLGLEARRVPQVAVTGLPIRHLYIESQQTPAALEEARTFTGLEKP